MLRHEAIAGLTNIHQKMNKMQKKLNNDVADALALTMAMFWQPGCIVIKEEHDS